MNFNGLKQHFCDCCYSKILNSEPGFKPNVWHDISLYNETVALHMGKILLLNIKNEIKLYTLDDLKFNDTDWNIHTAIMRRNYTQYLLPVPKEK